MNDAELVKQVLAGNNNAFRYLVAKNQQLVMHIVGRIVQQQDEIDDICQEVFIKVYRKIKRFRGESKLSTWIARIAYNTSISHVRKIRVRGELSFDEHPAFILQGDELAVSNNVYENDEVKKYMLATIEKLPVHYRTVLTLFHLEEFSYKEIEQITEMPEGTVKSYLSRARKILKKELEKIAEKEQTNIFADYHS